MSDPTAVPATTASSEAVSASRQPTSPPRRRGVLQMLKLMGPAFIVGAWQFGPGNLVSAVQAGSLYAYDLIWVIVLSTVLMLVFADMSRSEEHTAELKSLMRNSYAAFCLKKKTQK